MKKRLRPSSPSPIARRGPGRPRKRVKIDPRPLSPAQYRTKANVGISTKHNEEAEMSEGDTIIVNLTSSRFGSKIGNSAVNEESDDSLSEGDTIVVNIGPAITRLVSEETKRVHRADNHGDHDVPEPGDIDRLSTPFPEYTANLDMKEQYMVHQPMTDDPAGDESVAIDLVSGLPETSGSSDCHVDSPILDSVSIALDVKLQGASQLDINSLNHDVEPDKDPVIDQQATPAASASAPIVPHALQSELNISVEQDDNVRPMQDFEARLLQENKELIEENDQLHHQKDAGYAFVRKLHPICNAYHENLVKANSEVERYKSPDPRSTGASALPDDEESEGQDISGRATPVLVAQTAALKVVSPIIHEPQGPQHARPREQQSRAQPRARTQLGVELAAAYAMEDDTASFSSSTDGTEVLPVEEIVHRHMRLAKLKQTTKLIYDHSPQWLPVIPHCYSNKNPSLQQPSVVWIPCVPGLTLRRWASHVGPLPVPPILQGVDELSLSSYVLNI